MKEELSAFVLAGGKSSRMGQEKGLVHYRNKPLIAHVLEVAVQTAANVSIVTANPDYASLGFLLVADETPGLGPAAGVYTALSCSSSAFVLVIACDMPNIKPELIVAMFHAIGDADIIVAAQNGRVEPLLAIYHQTISLRWKQLLGSGIRKMTDFFSHFDCRIFDTSGFAGVNENLFININTPGDLGNP